jgi:N-acetylglucosaminyl-diphospho-decaprenol L-rhamnosyltransferase
MTQPVADVVVPTWNARDLLERCLARLGAQSAKLHVVVVDNGSADGTGELLAARFPEVTLVALPENIGFGPAVNRGVEAARTSRIVVLNNDVEADPEFVARIVAPLDGGRSGMVAGLLLRPGRNVVDSYGLELDRTLAAFPRFAGEPYRPEALHERSLAAPSGGAAAYRRDAFEAVGGFDERLFAYFEDVDLALRLHEERWTCVGARDAVGVHLGSASFARRSRRQVETAGVSRGYMLRKHAVFKGGVMTAATAVATEAAAVAADALLRRDLAALRGRMRGWRLAKGTELRLSRAAVNESIGLVGSLRRRRAGL